MGFRGSQTPAPPISMLASTWVPAKALIDCTTQDTFFPINIEIGGSGGRRFPPAYQIRVSHSPQTSFPRWRNNSGINRLGAPFRSILWARGRPLRCCRKKASSVFGRRMPSSFLEKKPSLLLGKTRPSSTLEKKTLSGPKRRGGCQPLTQARVPLQVSTINPPLSDPDRGGW